MRVLCFALSLAAATCQRVEEPAPAPAPVRQEPLKKTSSPALAPTPSASVVHVAPVAAPDAGRCLQPMSDTAPPAEEAASICPHDPDETPPVLKRGKIRIPEAKNAPGLDIEIADTPATEERGLMYRTKLAADSGMLFVWPNEKIRTFWMHNTCIPLDMLFVAKDGTVLGVLEQVPVLNDRGRQVPCPASYVLEVNAGWSRRHGVKPGMKLDIKL